MENQKKQIPISEHSGPRSAIMTRIVSVLLAITVLAACESKSVVDQIPFQGLADEHEGLAAWNTDGSAPEAANTGHLIPSNACGDIAFYYQASRDYVDVDPSSFIAFHVVADEVSGFDGFVTALENEGLNIKNLYMTWGVQSLGADMYLLDWSFSSPVETRIYTGGDFTIWLGGEAMVGGPMPRTTVTINYNVLTDCNDDSISAVTESVVPRKLSGGGLGAIQAVSAAFLRDLGTGGIRFEFDSFQPATGQAHFTGNGREGAFFDLQSGRIQTQATPHAMLVAWGNGGHGQLGVEWGRPDVKRLTPVPVSLNQLSAISAGYNYSLAITTDGTVWAWGYNLHGQLGDGTIISRQTPVLVSDLTNVVAVAAGGGDFGGPLSLALKNDGTVWAWGYQGHGVPSQKTPVAVSGLTDVVAVAAGGQHSMVLKSDGTVWAWGVNSQGQLGDGTTTWRYTPALVSGLTEITAIAAGDDHNLALGSDGTVWAWGKNNYGQLGDGTTTDRYTAVQVSGLTGVLAIAAGDRHSLAHKSGGTVWAWGQNDSFQLGDGTFIDRYTPALVSGLTGPIAITAIAAGAAHSLALKSNGTVWAWGQNFHGTMGDGTTTNRPTPVEVSGLTWPITAIAAGGVHNLALRGVP